MEEKCVCEWLKKQEFSANFKDCQEFQFEHVEIMFENKTNINIEYQPSLKTWKICAYSNGDVVYFTINYCPFCGSKLN